MTCLCSWKWTPGSGVSPELLTFWSCRPALLSRMMMVAISVVVGFLSMMTSAEDTSWSFASLITILDGLIADVTVRS